MVVEVEQPVYGGLRNAETARQFGLSQARGMEGHIELSLCCVKCGEANHAMFPAARLTGTRHHFALPDQISNHGANCIRGHLLGFVPRVSLSDSPIEVREPDEEAALFGGLENRGGFHDPAPSFLAPSRCSVRSPSRPHRTQMCLLCQESANRSARCAARSGPVR